MNLKSITLTLLFTLFLGACSNQGAFAPRKSATEDNVDEFLEDELDGGTSITAISNVLISNFNTSMFDIVGFNDGLIGQFCNLDIQTDDGTNTAPCTCNYEVLAGQNNGIVRTVDPIYVEQNLARCPKDNLQPGDEQIAVYLMFANLDGKISNKITLTISNPGSDIQIGKESSFVEVKRFQCRDRITIKNFLSGNSEVETYDPFLSESALISYPFNFYQGNLAQAIQSFAIQSGPDAPTFAPWECSYNIDTKWWESTKIYSQVPLAEKLDGTPVPANIASLIYPVPSPSQGVFDRYTFYLLSEPSGDFGTAVNVVEGPPNIRTAVANTNSDDEDEDQPAIPASPPAGFGALADAEDNCPDESVLPEGFEFVRLLLWRSGSIPAREIPLGTEDTGDGLSDRFLCNPGDVDVDGDDEAVFPDCRRPPQASNEPGGGANEDSLQDLNPEGLAARVINIGSPGGDEPEVACYEFDPTDGNDSNEAGGSNLFTGADQLERIAGADNIDGTFDFPWGLSPNSGTPSTPKSTIMSDDVGPAVSGENNRIDFVFTVAPTSIKRQDVEDLLNNDGSGNPTSPAAQYMPLRYTSVDFCEGNTPCSDKMRIVYQSCLSEFCVNQSGGNAPEIFPLCVARKKVQ